MLGDPNHYEKWFYDYSVVTTHSNTLCICVKKASRISAELVKIQSILDLPLYATLERANCPEDSLVGIAPMDAPNTELSFSFARFAEGFDQHIRQSIRGYVDLLSDCIALSEYFVEDGTVVFDVGCSTGTFLREIWRKNRDRCPNTRYIGIDIEDKFCNYWHEPNNNCVNLLVADARTFQIPEKCSFVTSIFSLQFIPPRERQTIVDKFPVHSFQVGL